jgi:amidohydrolase
MQPFPSLPTFSDDSFGFLQGCRRYLHQNPETGFTEHNTSAFIRMVLEQCGLKPHRIAGTGLYVDIGNPNASKKVGYRADIDALPIQDLKTVAYASTQVRKAHLCGHDAHTTIALGIANTLAQCADSLDGMVRIFFQPNEEGSPSGAPMMIEEGILDGLSAAFALHVDPTLPTGTFGLKTGASTAACDILRVNILGKKTGHSARPHETLDTIWVMHQVMNQLYQMIGRLTDSRNAAILTICQIFGGDAVNVIPKKVGFAGTLRMTDPQDVIFLRDFVRKIIENTCELYGATAEIEHFYGAPAVINDPELDDVLRETIHQHFSPSAIFNIPRPSMGAEDFSHYGVHIPTYLMRLGTQNSPETAYHLHDAHFDMDENALPLAVKAMSETLKAYLSR